MLAKSLRMHHRNTFQYLAGGLGNRGQTNCEVACHSTFIRLPGIITPLSFARSEIVMHLMYILQLLALSSLPIVIPMMLEKAFISDWSCKHWIGGDHWFSTYICPFIAHRRPHKWRIQLIPRYNISVLISSKIG